MKLTSFEDSIILEKSTVVMLFNLKIGMYKGHYQLNLCPNTLVRTNLEGITAAEELLQYCDEDFLADFIVKIKME